VKANSETAALALAIYAKPPTLKFGKRGTFVYANSVSNLSAQACANNGWLISPS
jgi:hypothetical protein